MYSRINNALGILRRQCQCPPDEQNTRGRKSAKTRRALWFVIISQSNHGSGGSIIVPSCPSHPKGVPTSYQSTNNENYILFMRWGVSHSRLNNAPGIHLHLCLYLKILLSINLIYYTPSVPKKPTFRLFFCPKRTQLLANQTTIIGTTEIQLSLLTQTPIISVL